MLNGRPAGLDKSSAVVFHVDVTPVGSERSHEVMELMPSADRVVREILPAAFDAAGSGEAASALRGLGRLSCHRSALLAAAALKSVRLRELRLSSETFRDAAFWCEKAVWAAASGDPSAFSRYIDAAHAAIREAMSSGGALN